MYGHHHRAAVGAGTQAGDRVRVERDRPGTPVARLAVAQHRGRSGRSSRPRIALASCRAPQRRLDRRVRRCRPAAAPRSARKLVEVVDELGSSRRRHACLVVADGAFLREHRPEHPHPVEPRGEVRTGRRAAEVASEHAERLAAGVRPGRRRRPRGTAGTASSRRLCGRVEDVLVPLLGLVEPLGAVERLRDQQRRVEEASQ